MTYGEFNPHAVGIVLKELVRRAMVTIQNQRHAFQVQEKEGYDGTMDDVFTSADTAAQKVYLRSLRECFPDFGIIAEEDDLMIESKNGYGYFTIDPLDGTKAFVRRQSHGIGTMIALVANGAVRSAWIGDICTGEIYGFRPDSENVHRITNLDISFNLTQIDRKLPLSEMYISLRDAPEQLTPEAQELVEKFRNMSVDGGSIGTWMARLWKGEVGAALLSPNTETPWDNTPVLGITRKLGFVTLRYVDGAWKEVPPEIYTEVTKRNYELLIIHKSCVEQLN